MSVLFPWFLAGIGAISLPIVFHLFKRSPRDRKPFSSLLFLEPSPPRLTRRSRLNDLLLLLLRAAALCLLAMAFARPFLRQTLADPNSAAKERVSLILVDSSASMRRTGLWEQAKEQVQAALGDVSEGDEAAVWLFDGQVRPLVEFDEWTKLAPAARKAHVQSVLSSEAPTWSDTRLDRALVRAAEAIEAQTVGHDRDENVIRRIVLISDLQEGSVLTGLQSLEWPEHVSVEVKPVRSDAPTNAGIEVAADADEGILQEEKPTMRFLVSNSSDSRREQFTVEWRNGADSQRSGDPVSVYVPPGQRRIVRLPIPPKQATGKAVLMGDEPDFDNTAYVVLPSADKVAVAFAGDEQNSDVAEMRRFVEQALKSNRWRDVEMIPAKSMPVGQAEIVRFAVVAPGASAAAVERVRSILERGGGALLVLAKPAATEIEGLAPGLQISVEEAAVSGDVMLSHVDFTHELFAPFADPRYSDFSKIRIWKHRKMALPESARILMRFDDGDPALAEISVGRGVLHVLATGWHRGDSQLALSSKFVPLVCGMLESALGEARTARQFHVGDVVKAPVRMQQEPSLRITLPDQSEIALSASDGLSLKETNAPGLYRIQGSTAESRFAVNLSSEESRTAPIDANLLEKVGVKLYRGTRSTGEASGDRSRQLMATQLEERQKGWRYVLVGAFLVILLESFLAGRASRAAAAS